MRILGHVFGHKEPSRGDAAFGAAMKQSDELIESMRASSQSNDAVAAMVATIWLQRHNIPFITTVYESVQEMKSGMENDTSS